MRGSDKGTDRIIASFFERSGVSLLRLLGIRDVEDSRIKVRSRVIKQQEIKPDLEVSELMVRGEDMRVYVEVQGYYDKYVIYRAISGGLLASRMDDYDGDILVGIIYLRDRYRSGVINPVGEGGKIRVREVSIEEYDIEELIRIDKRLVIFLPYTKGIRNERDLVSKYREVEGEVSSIDDILRDELVMMVVSRFKRLSIWEVIDMFRIEIKDSVAFKEVYEIGIKEGIREGEYRRAIEDARRMYELGADIDFIKRVVGILSEEELKRVLGV